MSNLSVEKLLETELEMRDQAWEKAFLSVLPHAAIKVISPEPTEGPDGWPYLLVQTGEGSDDNVANVLGWLSTRGIGLVLNPEKPMPDFVLTWGMIWNYRERGEFYSIGQGGQTGRAGSKDAASTGRFEVKHGQELLAGPPSEAFLPKYVRAVLKQFLMDQGVFTPKVLMVSTDKVNFDLCFSIESLKSPPPHEHANIVEALSWFLPGHYSVSLLSEKTVQGFVAL